MILNGKCEKSWGKGTLQNLCSSKWVQKSVETYALDKLNEDLENYEELIEFGKIYYEN